LPEIDKVEIVEVRVVELDAVTAAVVPPTVTEAQVIVPAPCIVAAVLAAAALRRVIPAVTVRVTPELTVKVAAVALVLLKLIELIVASSVTVTESPGRITISSVGDGTVPPGQGALTVVEFQLPLPAVVMVAACAGAAIDTARPSKTTSAIIANSIFFILQLSLGRYRFFLK
jgi:hypothetical protein